MAVNYNLKRKKKLEKCGILGSIPAAVQILIYVKCEGNH